MHRQEEPANRRTGQGFGSPMANVSHAGLRGVSGVQVAGDDLADADLVRAARAGDESAFSELYRRHAGAVTALARSRLRDRSAADDVSQEAFATAMARLDQLRDDERFASWVRTIAVNLCSRFNRQLPHVPLVIDLADDTWDAPEGVVERSETVSSVRAALAMLSPGDRRLLVLRHFEGRRLAEVAAARGLTYGSAEVAMSRARRRLRIALQRAGLVVAAVAIGSWRRFGRWFSASPLNMGVAAVAVPGVVLGAAITLGGMEVGAGGWVAAPSVGDSSVSTAPPVHVPATGARQSGNRLRTIRSGASPSRAVPAGRPVRSPPIEVGGIVEVSREKRDHPESVAVRLATEVAEDRNSTGVSGGYEDLCPSTDSPRPDPVEERRGVDAGPAAVTVVVSNHGC